MNEFNLVDKIIAYESGELNEEEIIELFQYLIDTGKAWTLQGSYGRMAMHLIEVGACKKPLGKVTIKKGTEIEVDSEKVSQWSERVVSAGEIVNDTVVTSKSTRILCYLEKCGGNFTVPAGEIWLVDEERYLI